MENKDSQEIDLGVIFSQIKNFFRSCISGFFKMIQYIIKNIIKIGIILFIGSVFGYLIDKTEVSYHQQIVVSPNLNSVDYFYKRINLLNALLKEKDTNFLYQKGFRNIKNIKKIKVEPIIDIFKFVETYRDQNPNFDMIKLMAEDGDLNKIIKDEMTSKNYPFHEISFSTSKKINEESLLKPIINFLNESKYYQSYLKQYTININEKINQNDSIIKQIDAVLKSFKSNENKSSSLVYYNENTQLNEIINTKYRLIEEKGNLKTELLKLDKIIKEISYTFNIKDKEGVNGKMLFIMPIIFLLMFFGTSYFIKSYKKYTT
ncbi:MAG: hypothetical protein ACOVQ2_07745 [Flavobacterium sp.]